MLREMLKNTPPEMEEHAALAAIQQLVEKVCTEVDATSVRRQPTAAQPPFTLTSITHPIAREACLPTPPTPHHSMVAGE